MVDALPDGPRIDVDICYLAHAFDGLDATPLPVACVHLEPPGSGVKPSVVLPRRVVLLCDVSGSMNQQIHILRDTVQQIHDDLAPNDELGVVVFDDDAEVALHLTRKKHIEDLGPCLKKISSGGTTNIEAALRAAWDITEGARRSSKSPETNELPTIWLLLSDGQPNRGEQGQENLVKLARDAAQACHPLVVHSLGFGHGHDVSMMCALASTGSVACGAYTFLQVNADIPAAVGDVLGMFSSAPAMADVALGARWGGAGTGAGEPEEEQIHLSAEQQGLFALRSSSERGGQLELSRETLRLPVLFPDRVETVIALCDTGMSVSAAQAPSQAPAGQVAHGGGTLNLSLSWTDTREGSCSASGSGSGSGTQQSPRRQEQRVCFCLPRAAKSRVLDLSALTAEEKNDSKESLEGLPASGLIVLGHVLRLRVAAALVLCDEIQRRQLWRQDAQQWTCIFEPLVQLHGTALAVLRAIRQRLASAGTPCPPPAAPEQQVLPHSPSPAPWPAQSSNSGSASGAGSGGGGAVGGSDRELRQLKLAEGFLQALERDLGEALTVKSAEKIADQRLRGVFLAFAHEHFAMRSASSMTACRTTYASSQQLQARFRFIRGVAGSGGENCPKRRLKPEQLEPSLAAGGALTEEEIVCRRAADDAACLYTLCTWRECLLGIGLYVHERGVRDRQCGLPPEMDLVPDYVSAEAYNEGVRAEQLSGEGDHQGLVSSVRGRINGWMPLYLNETNWREARLWAPSALSLLSTQLAGAFNPKAALKVFGRILCGAMVSFSRSEACERPEAARLSLRTLQLCAEVHRLFLAVARDHPGMSQEADTCLARFRESPKWRTRQTVPNLGDLLTYLLLSASSTSASASASASASPTATAAAARASSRLQWPDIAAAFAFEMLRREAGRMEAGAGLDLNRVLPSGPSTSDDAMAESDDAIAERVLQVWDERAPGHGLVVLLTLQLVKALRPAEKSIEEVCVGYDRRWGRLPESVLEHLLAEAKRIQAITSVRAVLAELLGEEAGSLQACAKLVLAANEMRREEEYLRVAERGGHCFPPSTTPSDKAQVPVVPESLSCPGQQKSFLSTLREERQLWQMIEQSVRPPVSYLPPMQKRRRRAAAPRLAGLAEAVAELGWDQGRPGGTAEQEQEPRDRTHPNDYLKEEAVATPISRQRKRFRHGGDLRAWRNAPWDAERARKTLVLARLRLRSAAGLTGEEEPETVLKASGLEGLLRVRIRREAGSKRGRERHMAFAEFDSEAAATSALDRLQGDEAIVHRRGWLVDRAKRGVDPNFVPHRFLGELLWERVNQRKRQRDELGPRERHSCSPSSRSSRSSSLGQ